MVDSVRSITEDWQSKGRCKTFRLVLGGSGVESLIENKSKKSNGTTFFGTDPSKSIVVTLQGPATNDSEFQANLEWYLRRQNLKPQIAPAILQGTFSRVLCTNSRMLFDGLIGTVLSNKVFTAYYASNYQEEAEIERRLKDLCSSRIPMAFVPRIYFSLNALSRYDAKDKEKYINEAFRILSETLRDQRRTLSCT